MAIQIWCIFCNVWSLVKAVISDFKVLWWFRVLSRKIHRMLSGPEVIYVLSSKEFKSSYYWTLFSNSYGPIRKHVYTYVHILKNQLYESDGVWERVIGFTDYLFDLPLICLVTNSLFPGISEKLNFMLQSKIRWKYKPLGLYLRDFSV